MASTQEFADFVIQQSDVHLGVTHKKMFGEYGLFSGGKMFAMICDDRVLCKPTTGGRDWIGTVLEALPYSGARPCFLIEDRLEDREWLSELARITIRELPAPKPKRPKPKK